MNNRCYRYARQKHCHCRQPEARWRLSTSVIQDDFGAVVSSPISITLPNPTLNYRSRSFLPLSVIRACRSLLCKDHFAHTTCPRPFPTYNSSSLSDTSFIFAWLCCYPILQWLPTTSSHAVFLVYHAMLMELGNYPAAIQRGCWRTRRCRELHSTTMVF